MIHLRSLRKAFGSIVAVDGLSLEVRRGETIGLLGPNGAGKSTTINMIVGLLRPDSGEVSVDGGQGPHDPVVRRRIGVSPQALAIYEDLTGAENVAFFGRMYGLSGHGLAERTRWALEFTGLSSRAGDRAATYSGGMKRRLNIACAVVHKPDIILFDEPTVGVDPQSRNQIFDTIEALKRDGVTILYTTHYMEEAARLCDRVAIIDGGRLLALDTVDALIETHGGDSLVELEFDADPADHSALEGSWNGRLFTTRSSRPVDVIAAVPRVGANLRRLAVERPTLEHVFLKLTGRSLRDQ